MDVFRLAKPMKNRLFTFFVGLALMGCQHQIDRQPNTVESSASVAEPSDESIQITVHARVDTSNSEIREMATLWINYLQSEPDKIANSDFWNSEEQALYVDYDLSRALLYQFPAEQLLRYYQPTILSIEKEGEAYGIRTMYAAEGLEAEYRSSNPWAIQKVYAVKENDTWKLKNGLPVYTAHWTKETIGKITFIYPPTHAFNRELAAQANQFCNELVRKFQFPDWEPFDFYITHSGDEMGKLLNFEFFFAGYTTGLGMHANRMLFSGLGSEYYPHEFVHLIVPAFDRHSLIEEGFATWQGGQGELSFEASAKRLAHELAANDTVTLADVVEKKWGWHCAAYYTTGAIFFNSAFSQGGVERVHELLNIPNNNDVLMANLCTVLKIDEAELDGFWRKEIMKFNKN
jgi:hypothetical protein